MLTQTSKIEKNIIDWKYYHYAEVISVLLFLHDPRSRTMYTIFHCKDSPTLGTEELARRENQSWHRQAWLLTWIFHTFIKRPHLGKVTVARTLRQDFRFRYIIIEPEGVQGPWPLSLNECRKRNRKSWSNPGKWQNGNFLRFGLSSEVLSYYTFRRSIGREKWSSERTWRRIRYLTNDFPDAGVFVSIM